MSADTFNPLRSRIPVWPVVERSYLYVWEYRELFALPVIAVFVLVLAIGLLTAAPGQPVPTGAPHIPLGELFVSGVGNIGIVIISLAFVVGVHRTVLLDEQRGGLAFFRIDRNLARYFWTLILFFLLMVLAELAIGIIIALVAGIGAVIIKLTGAAAAGFATGLITVVGGGAAIIAIAAIAFRLSLSLPAAAVGDQKRFSLSWTATKGNAARLFAITVLTQLPFIIIWLFFLFPYLGEGISATIHHRTPELTHPGLVVQILLAAVKAVSLPILTAMLSLSYDILVRGGGPVPTLR